MKKLLTLVIFVLSLAALAQTPPVIESTYYPVRNTSIKQVWDTVPTSMSVPTTGPNQVWDYRFSNNQFLHAVDTFRFKMLDPATTPYSQYFPGATHACFIQTPFDNISDSLYGYFKVDYNGLHDMGGFNTKAQFDSTFIINPTEYYAPPSLVYGWSKADTSLYTVFAKNYKYLGYKAKVKGRRIKNFSYAGYGTLRLPNGDYNNVAMVHEVYSTKDSVFVDFQNNGNYVFFTINTTSGHLYEFLRNNTFGSAYLMYLAGNPSNTQIDYGWYTLPVDFGTIKGTVFTSTTESTPVTDGEAYLYRENSNFTKNDILARATLNSSGVYQFDSIPFGEYRIAIRPNTSVYSNSKITYYGDTTNWIDAVPIITTGTLSANNNIHLQYNPAPAGANDIQGTLNQNLGIFRTLNPNSNPIPSIGVVVKKNPGSAAARVGITDNSGNFHFPALEDGSYTIFVDIPGLHHAGTYSFTISGGNVLNGLDFTVGTDSIHPTNAMVGIKETKASQAGFMTAYPNPYHGNVTVALNLPFQSQVALEAYDVLGRKIQVIDQGLKQPGVYKYSFSAKELDYAPGVYFIKLRANDKTDVLKLIEQ